MAGIGFVLRNLYKKDDLSGFAAACLHSAFASAGPWLFTVVALSVISMVGKSLVGFDAVFNFRIILVYNFSFSLMISGPIYMIVTRYLSDKIYCRDVAGAPGFLFGALVMLWLLEIVIAGTFYTFYANLGAAMTVSAIINFLLLSAVWLVGIFISAMRNYKLITRSFIAGMILAVLGSIVFSANFGAVGIVNGFSLGLCVIIGLLLGNVLAEYPYPLKQPFVFMPYFRKYWEIALGGLVYNAAIWVDKWIMWFAPEATRMDNHLVIYPLYDSTMFIAYLTTVPAMALFLFSTETNFFEHYTRFYRDIERKASFAKIEQNHGKIMRAIFGSYGNFFVLQGGIAFFGIVLAPQIIMFLKGNYLQIGMLRYGLLGAFFQVLTLFLVVLLTYFDNRKTCLQIQLVFLVTNALFTIISVNAGFAYYGFGYFLAAFFTFLVASFATTQYIRKLPYHTFITSNASIGQ